MVFATGPAKFQKRTYLYEYLKIQGHHLGRGSGGAPPNMFPFLLFTSFPYSSFSPFLLFSFSAFLLFFFSLFLLFSFSPFLFFSFSASLPFPFFSFSLFFFSPILLFSFSSFPSFLFSPFPYFFFSPFPNLYTEPLQYLKANGVPGQPHVMKYVLWEHLVVLQLNHKGNLPWCYFCLWSSLISILLHDH